MSLRGDKSDEAIQLQDYIFNHETLGFRLDDRDDIKQSIKSQKITDLRSFALAIITFLQTNASRSHINKEDWARTICIDTTGVGITEFDLPEKKVKTLLASGQQGVITYLEWRSQAGSRHIKLT